MIIGVYGVGYTAASLNLLRHWPIVLVGLLGKVFGLIGFLTAVANDELPLSFGLILLTNDLIWWAPFALILLRSYQANRITKETSARAAAEQRSPMPQAAHKTISQRRSER